jgi:acetolactate synthase-1/2/3 large subunit
VNDLKTAWRARHNAAMTSDDLPMRPERLTTDLTAIMPGDAVVLVDTGDAGFYYHLAEIETAVRYNINTVTIVNDNSGGNQSKRGFDRAYRGEPTEASRRMWTYNDVDLAKVATDMGALGIRVDKSGDLRPSLERALAADRPALIDVRTDIEVTAPPAVS